MNSKIESIKAREVYDVYYLPTIEAEIVLKSGLKASAICPAGTSTGINEAKELRDGDQSWYDGKGVSGAVDNINNEIQKNLVGLDVFKQEEIDKLLVDLDGTPNKARLGANAIVVTSYAVAKAAAKEKHIPIYRHLLGGEKINLPIPWVLIIGGALSARSNFDFQEWLIAPVCAKSYREFFHITWKINSFAVKTLKDEMKNRLAFSPGGRLAPIFESNEEGTDFLNKVIKKAGYSPGTDILVYIDVAASHFVKNNKYNLKKENKNISSLEMIDYLNNIIEKYSIYAIEDGLGEEDWDGWVALTEKIGKKVDIVGDDLFVTNPGILAKGIEKNIANAVLIKVNQIGTITEAKKTVGLAKQNNYKNIISARSREAVEETIIAHLAIGLNVDGAKIGSSSTTNEFIRIEESLIENNIPFSYSWLGNKF